MDLVDAEDRIVGKATLPECLAGGLLHRAVAVLVTRTDGALLLQRRSLKDLWHPGLWTLSSTGHVRRGEKYSAAAKRELKEELGLRSPIKPLSKVLLPRIKSRGLTEFEWVSIFITENDAEPSIDPVELESVEAFRPAEVRKMLGTDKLTPDAKITLRAYFDSLR